MSENLAIVVLAGGQGTRMKSALPKMLHQAAGRPITEHVVRAARALGPQEIVVVVGHGGDKVRASLEHLKPSFVTQDFSTGYGTGHAMMQARDVLGDFQGDIMVLSGDEPLIRSEALKELLKLKTSTDSGMGLVTCEVDNAIGLGRVVRNVDGSVAHIVEQKDANPEELAIQEINPGLYLFDSTVFAKGERLNSDNAAGEYYITDLPAMYQEEGASICAVKGERNEFLGVNNRKQLARADGILRQRIRDKWMMAGVTMIHPESIYIDDTVELENDVILGPNVHLKGSAVIRTGVTVPANVMIDGIEVTPAMRLEPFKVYSTS